MTAAADFTKGSATTREPVSMVDGGRMLARTLQRICGAGLFLAAFVIWLAPGTAEAEMMLFRLLLSVAAAVAGLGMMLASSKPEAPEIEIDTIRRTVSLVRPDGYGVREVLTCSSFAELGAAEVSGPVVRLWDAQGVLLAVATLTDTSLRNSLINGLRDAGKIA